MRTITINGEPFNVYFEDVVVRDDGPMVRAVHNLGYESAYGTWVPGNTPYQYDQPINDIDQTRLFSEREKLLVRWPVGTKATKIHILSGDEPPVLGRWKPCRITNDRSLEFAGSYNLLFLDDKEAQMVFQERQIEVLKNSTAAAQAMAKSQPDTAQPAQTLPECYTTMQAAADYANVSVRTIGQWIHDNLVSDGRKRDKDDKPVGRKLQIKRSDLDKWARPSKAPAKPVKETPH